MQSLPSIKKCKKFEGKKILVRVDFNVPVKNGKVLENTRILSALPTIQYLLEKKAKVILVTHLGRPDGGVVSELKLDPIARMVSKLIGKKVKKLEIRNEKWEMKQVLSRIQKIEGGEIIMLENVRFHPEEERNSDEFAQALASLCDYFVLDGFGVAHREAASVSGVAKYVKSYAGLLLEKEVKGLNKAVEKPKSPFVVVLGGVKMETKVPVMKQLLPKADHVLIGGGIVNTYLKALGYRIGDSLVDAACKQDALKYCKARKVIKPVDVVVGTKDGKHVRVVQLKKSPHQVCKKGEAIFDIGPETIRVYASYIKQAQTILWNGAMGYFEQKPFDIGTLSIARLVASRSKGKAYGVIGGGETVQAMEMVGMTEFVDLVSTGGGAMLEYVAGKKLPGIKALKK